MEKLFDIVFLDETFEFKKFEKKHYEKILFNIQHKHDMILNYSKN